MWVVSVLVSGRSSRVCVCVRVRRSVKRVGVSRASECSAAADERKRVVRQVRRGGARARVRWLSSQTRECVRAASDAPDVARWPLTCAVQVLLPPSSSLEGKRASTCLLFTEATCALRCHSRRQGNERALTALRAWRMAPVRALFCFGTLARTASHAHGAALPRHRASQLHDTSKQAGAQPATPPLLPPTARTKVRTFTL